MAGGGSPSQVTSTQTSDPWGPQQPYLTEGFERARGLLDSEMPEYYPGQTVTDVAGPTAWGQHTGFSQAGANADLTARTVRGDYLNAGNPHFQGMVDQIGRAVRPNIDSTFAASGRLGSGAHANAYASALTDQAGKLAYQNYGDERGRQIAASQDYSAPQAMVGIGGQMEQQQGRYLQDAAARWDFEQNADINRLNQYMGIVGNRSYGGQQQSTQPYTGNSTMQGIGTALSGIGALGQLGQGLPGILSLFR